jgi:hypothetical protein
MTQLVAQAPLQPRPKPRRKPTDSGNDAQVAMSMFHLGPRKPASAAPNTSKRTTKNSSRTTVTQNNLLLPPKPLLTRAAAGN